MSAIRTALVPVLLGVLVAAAVPTHGAAQEGQRGSTADVVVSNRASSGTHVYLLQEGHMVPLGFLDAGATETLSIPPIFVESGEAIRLLADPIEATEWFESEPLAVRSGNEIRLTVEPDFERSTVAVNR